jgi:hypothetical protein
MAPTVAVDEGKDRLTVHTAQWVSAFNARGTDAGNEPQEPCFGEYCTDVCESLLSPSHASCGSLTQGREGFGLRADHQGEGQDREQRDELQVERPGNRYRAMMAAMVPTWIVVAPNRAMTT